MSEETLRRFLERLNGDASFRESAQSNPVSAFEEFGLSATERVAVTTSDEDALRRLAGADVSPFIIEGFLLRIPQTNPVQYCPGVGRLPR